MPSLLTYKLRARTLGGTGTWLRKTVLRRFAGAISYFRSYVRAGTLGWPNRPFPPPLGQIRGSASVPRLEAAGRQARVLREEN